MRSASKPRSLTTPLRAHAYRVVAALALLALPTTVLAQAAPPPETIFSVLESAVDELPKDSFDYAAALAAIGDPSVEAIFAWVRDETGFVAYRGALKGAAGALMDREGNSLDRALLLERLLEEGGHSAIVARATLSGAELEAAVAALRSAPADEAPAQDAAQLTDRAAAELGLDPALLAERLDQGRQNSERLSLDVERATAAQLSAITEIVAASPAAQAAADDAAALLADHWWIQVDQGGAWVDLDPTLPGAVVGTPLAAAELRFDLPEVRFLAAVDGACRDLSCGDRLHRVKLAVVIETWDGEQLAEQELVSTELLAADGVGRRIAFTALPSNWPEDLDLYGVAAPVDVMREQLLATDEWHPALFVGDASFGTTRVDASGATRDSAGGGGPAGNAGMLGGGIGGMFGGFGGAAAGDSGEEEGAFTALWLDYTVHTPGLGERTHRREVFDLIGPAARRAGVSAVELSEADRLTRALALGGQTDIVISGAGLTQEALQFAAAQRLLGNREAWSELYHQGSTLDPAVINQRLNDTAELYGPLETFQVLRSERLQGYQAGAFVAAFHQRFQPDLSVSNSFDLVYGGIAAPPAADGFAARLAQGVLDTVLESELLERLEGGDPASADAVTVPEAFAADLAAGRSWRLVADPAELRDVAPALPADLRARVEIDLAAGRLALVPEGGDGAVGWWSLDPRTGALLGIGSRGWGQATSEYATATNVVLQLRTALNQYASMSRCLGLALTGPLRGLTSEDADMELQKCVFTTICSAVNTAASFYPKLDDTWTNVITMAAIDALWGGVPEAGYGGLCGSLWNKYAGG